MNRGIRREEGTALYSVSVLRATGDKELCKVYRFSGLLAIKSSVKCIGSQGYWR
jgi:hypothetical protein